MKVVTYNIKILILTITLLILWIPEVFSQNFEKEKLLQFEEAITRGEEFLQAKDYAKAKAEYQKALSINPSAKYPKDKLVQIRKLYTDPQDEVMFSNAVSRGDKFTELGQFKEAKEQYAAALLVNPDDRIVRDKMATADKLSLENDKRIAEYNKIIESADKLFNSKDYQSALLNYKSASELNKTNNYPINKIQEIETILAKEQALNDNYNSIVTQADDAYMNREFSIAKIRYEEASRLKPSENYPKSMLEKVDQALVNQVKNAQDIGRQKEKELAEQKRLDSLKSENEKTRIEELKTLEENKRQLAIREQQIQDSITAEEQIRLAESKRIEEEKLAESKRIEEQKQAAILAENILKQKIADSIRVAKENLEEAERIAEQDRQAAELAENLTNQRIEDSLRVANTEKLEAERKVEEERQASIVKEELARTKTSDSLKAIEETINAQKLEQERIDFIAAKDKAKNDSLYAIEQSQILAAKQAEETRVAEAARIEEEKKKELELALLSQIDKDYAEAIEQGNRLTTEQDYPSAIKAYERASDLKPMEEFPKDRIIALNNYLLERLKNNLESYNKFIAAADLAYQSNIFDKAIDEYTKALLTRPEETYPSNMIDKIKKLMEDNAMIDLVDNTTILINSSEQRFNFKPIDMRLRKNNYIVIKARKTSEKAPKVFINYGKDSQKSGGIVMKGVESEETTDYLLRISIQDSWYRVDNNWISIYPEGGDLEISEIQISQGDIQKLQ